MLIKPSVLFLVAGLLDTWPAVVYSGLNDEAALEDLPAWVEWSILDRIIVELYQKTKFLIPRDSISWPDMLIEDVNHGDLTARYSSGPGPSVHKELTHIVFALKPSFPIFSSIILVFCNIFYLFFYFKENPLCNYEIHYRKTNFFFLRNTIFFLISFYVYRFWKQNYETHLQNNTIRSKGITWQGIYKTKSLTTMGSSNAICEEEKWIPKALYWLHRV